MRVQAVALPIWYICLVACISFARESSATSSLAQSFELFQKPSNKDTLIIVALFTTTPSNIKFKKIESNSWQEREQHNRELLDSNVIPNRTPTPPPVPAPLMPELAKEPSTKIEFIISYKALSQNGIITGERYSISDPINLKSNRLKVAYTCTLNTPINDIITDDELYAIKYILTHYQEEVLECLRRGRVGVRYDGRVQESIYLNDSTLLEIPPQRVLAYFDNRYLILEVLKE